MTDTRENAATRVAGIVPAAGTGRRREQGNMTMASTETWSPAQRHVVLASFLGWMLDAFDFFLVVFVLKRIAGDFGTDVKSVTYALFLTLAMRPVGAFLFGRLADRFGRRPALMASVLSYSIMEFASAFAPSLRCSWCCARSTASPWAASGASAPRWRSSPYRSARAASSRACCRPAIRAATCWPRSCSGCCSISIGWRGMFMRRRGTGAAGAVHPQQGAGVRGLACGPRSQPAAKSLWSALSGHWPLALYAIAADDLLQLLQPRHPGSVSALPRGAARLFHAAPCRIIAIVYNIGAICGGIAFGALSSRIGRRRAIALAAGAGAAGAAVLGLRTTAAGAGAGGVRDAVHGAGRLGCGAGASQRALAARACAPPFRASSTSSAI